MAIMEENRNLSNPQRGCISVGEVPQREPDVNQGARELNYAIQDLQDVYSQLVNRVQPVIRNDCTGNKCAPEPVRPAGSCTVSEEFYRNAYVLKDITNSIRNLLDTLEV